MSGESPREEKLLVRNCGINDERLYQATNDGVAIGMATAAAQTSRQQLTVWDSLGQHGFCESE